MQIRILHDNVLNIDFSEATCIFVYLVPEGMLLLRDLLRAAIERGVRVVTYGTTQYVTIFVDFCLLQSAVILYATCVTVST